MSYSRLHLLPICLGILFPLTFIGTYIAAVLLDHVPPDLPFISDAGSHLPESCYFGQLLNLAAAMMVLCVYIRHRQLLAQIPPHRPPIRVLQSSLWSGCIAAFGVSMVANFQLANLPLVHAIGAFLAFGVGIIFFWIQVKCTKFDPPERYSRNFVRFRWILSCLASVFFLLTIVAGSVSYLKRGGPRPEDSYRGPGYVWFLICSGSEWITAFILVIYITSFSRDFRHISLTTPQAQIRT